MIFITKNSAIGKSYHMSEWVTPGGGNLKFFAHKNNYTKHLVNLISQYITAKEHGDSVGDGVNTIMNSNENPLRNLTPYEKEYVKKFSFVDSMRLKKGIDTLYTFTKVLPVIKHFNAKLYYVGIRENKDTIVIKRTLKNTVDLLNKQNVINQKIADETFQKGNY